MAFLKFEDINPNDAVKKAPNEFGEIHFENISYSVPRYAYKFWNKEKKEILHDVSGDFPSHKLSAIIGPSGCGKSTLMDIVSGYKSRGYSGSVYVNSEEINHSNKFVKQNSYIMQDDDLCPFLTVQEAMTFVTGVCLPSTMTLEFRDTKMLKILKEFSLLEQRKTLTKDLSGGERKRLAIALELISNPPVLFLDEPISGLDWVSAKQCIEILNKLSREGKTVVCSVHQPSMSLLQLFHHIYILCNGRCVYQGSVDKLVPYMSSLKYECPTNHNPVEYMLEICIFGEENEYDNLVQTIENGQSQNWFDVPTCWQRISLGTTLKMKTVRSRGMIGPTYPTSFKEQTKYLVKRIVQSTIRDPFLTRTNILVYLIMSLTLGLVFYNIGNDAAQAMANFNFLFYCIMLVMFTALSTKLVTVSQNINIIRREHFNHRYSLKSYYFATTLIDFILQILPITLFGILTYYLSGQILELSRLAKHLIIMNLVALVFQDYGMLIGMLLNITNGMIFGVFTTAPWVVFSGFFIFYRDTAYPFRLMFDISVLRKALEAVMVTVYNERKALNCFQVFCYFKYPSFFLQSIDMEGKSYTINLVILLLYYLVVKVSCYLTIRYKVVQER